jgi:hypothetical protein
MDNRLTASSRFGIQLGTQLESAVANCPKECRRQALACVQLALDLALPKDKETFARLATRWISLANDLEAIEAQLQSETISRQRTGT